MSAPLKGQVSGGFAPAPAHVPATHAPEVVLQKAPAAFPAHWESVVHFPQRLAVVTPHRGPAAPAAVQSESVRQLPAEHTPARHRYPLPPPYAAEQLPSSVGSVHEEHTVASHNPFAPPLLHAALVAPQLGAASEASAAEPESEASGAPDSPDVAGESGLVSASVAESAASGPGVPVSPESSPGAVAESPESSPEPGPPSGWGIVASLPPSPSPASEEGESLPPSWPPSLGLELPPHPDRPTFSAKLPAAQAKSQPRRDPSELIN
jgi:hypothetical protein